MVQILQKLICLKDLLLESIKVFSLLGVEMDINLIVIQFMQKKNCIFLPSSSSSKYNRCTTHFSCLPFGFIPAR